MIIKHFILGLKKRYYSIFKVRLRFLRLVSVLPADNAQHSPSCDTHSTGKVLFWSDFMWPKNVFDADPSTSMHHWGPVYALFGSLKGVMTCNFHFSTRINVCYDCLTIIHWPGSRYLKVKRLFTPGFVNQPTCMRTQIWDFNFCPDLTSRRGRIYHIWTPQTYAAGSPPCPSPPHIQSRKMQKRSAHVSCSVVDCQNQHVT